MKRCSYCGTDNPDDAEICEECGQEAFDEERVEEDANEELDELPPIKAKLLFEPLKPEELGNDWVTLVNCASLMEADVVVSHLEAADIPAFIPDEFAAQTTPFSLKGAGFVRVQVSPKDYQEAREYLSAFDKDEDDNEPHEESSEAE